MSAVAIHAEGLGKEYVIGAREGGYRTLRETLVDGLAAPFRRLGASDNSAADGRKFWALKDVGFTIEPGEVVGIIGRNGAGKSTLLKILSRITAPTTGSVRIHGRVASLLEVGTGFHPELTGRENIYLNAAILGMTRREINRKFDEIIAFAEVEKFLDTPVKRYSSGMSVRLAFAVAAFIEPEILIVDEVLAVGDVGFQEKCLGKMDSVAHSAGRTVIFVSHNMPAVQRLCERALLLRDGRVVKDGEPAEVVRAYLADANSTGVPVRDWRDRVSNGEGRIVGFECLDEDGKPLTMVRVGSTLRFRIMAEIGQPLRAPVFGVQVHNAMGEPVLDLRSSHDGLRTGRTLGGIVVEATLADVGLYPGEYTLSPWIMDGGSHHDVDWVKHCARIRVTPALFNLNPQLGKYFVRATWEARKAH